MWAEFVKFCESFDLAMAASVNQDDLLEVLENEEGDTNSGESEWNHEINGYGDFVLCT